MSTSVPLGPTFCKSTLDVKTKVEKLDDLLKITSAIISSNKKIKNFCTLQMS